MTLRSALNWPARSPLGQRGAPSPREPPAERQRERSHTASTQNRPTSSCRNREIWLKLNQGNTCHRIKEIHLSYVIKQAGWLLSEKRTQTASKQNKTSPLAPAPIMRVIVSGMKKKISTCFSLSCCERWLPASQPDQATYTIIIMYASESIFCNTSGSICLAEVSFTM